MKEFRADFHIHTNYSYDVGLRPDMGDYIKAAEEIGLDEIAFTDHIDYGVKIFTPFSASGYAKSVRDAAALGKTRVRLGIEAGLMDEGLSDTADFVRSLAPDFVIASQHIVDGMDVYCDPAFFSAGKINAYSRYLRVQYDMLKKFDDWSVVGHIGYFSRYYPGEDKLLKRSDAPDVIDEILRLAVSKGRGIEINTSGLSATGDVLPPAGIIARYIELGGEIITLGSDCHSISRLYDGIALAREKLKSLNARYFATYMAMKPVFHSL